MGRLLTAILTFATIASLGGQRSPCRAQSVPIAGDSSADRTPERGEYR